MTIRSLLLLGATAIVGPVGALAEEILFCGSAPYYASQYTCYDSEFLCPILYGQPTLRCGDACHSPDLYWCDGTPQLRQLPIMPVGYPYKLLVQSSNPALDGRTVHVSGLQFRAGADAVTTTYCYNAPPLYDCSLYVNQTILLENGSMSVDVPGGQFWYVDPDTGLLRTTAAGKAAGPERYLAGLGVTTYHDGYFWYTGKSYWLACKEPGDAEIYNIAMPITDDDGGCERIRLVSENTAIFRGAYSYT
ncbi:hypothetical protein VTJ49DRAFT_1268 [Mycothermus thermophilus]|uniref:Endo-1,3(4)-beta-glucanase 1 carbohydrate binding domain-containing protein n=1 Tax=Humicola insolens TaxID=85995 RepID=A0ABR3VEH3_HUMIN